MLILMCIYCVGGKPVSDARGNNMCCAEEQSIRHIINVSYLNKILK